MTTHATELVPHPASAGDAIRRVTASVAPDAGHASLEFRFRVEGNMARLRLPSTGSPRRSDGLWQHSCFEAFLRPDASDSYHEFNFAPSGDWAAYRFGGRRRGRASPEIPAPTIEFSRGKDACDLSARIALTAMPELARAAAIEVGLAAVLETGDGRLSFWALAHAGDKPDFHDPAGFTLRLCPS